MSRSVACLKTAYGEIFLNIRVSPQARHIGLRVDARLGGAELVLPKGVSEKSGLNFAKSKTNWLIDHLAAMPTPIPFTDGAKVPILGQNHQIRHVSCRGPKGPVWRDKESIFVNGQTPHIPRRIQDWLKTQARHEITTRALSAAKILDVEIKRISLRDPRSRWGSCSTAGMLSFSWRLILAPENVLNYVVMHEVAHRVEMNHGPSFWALVERIAGETETPRNWLNLHGTSLHRYGQR